MKRVEQKCRQKAIGNLNVILKPSFVQFKVRKLPRTDIKHKIKRNRFFCNNINKKYFKIKDKENFLLQWNRVLSLLFTDQDLPIDKNSTARNLMNNKSLRTSINTAETSQHIDQIVKRSDYSVRDHLDRCEGTCNVLEGELEIFASPLPKKYPILEEVTPKRHCYNNNYDVQNGTAFGKIMGDSSFKHDDAKENLTAIPITKAYKQCTEQNKNKLLITNSKSIIGQLQVDVSADNRSIQSKDAELQDFILFLDESIKNSKSDKDNLCANEPDKKQQFTLEKEKLAGGDLLDNDNQDQGNAKSIELSLLERDVLLQEQKNVLDPFNYAENTKRYRHQANDTVQHNNNSISPDNLNPKNYFYNRINENDLPGPNKFFKKQPHDGEQQAVNSYEINTIQNSKSTQVHLTQQIKIENEIKKHQENTCFIDLQVNEPTPVDAQITELPKLLHAAETNDSSLHLLNSSSAIKVYNEYQTEDTGCNIKYSDQNIKRELNVKAIIKSIKRSKIEDVDLSSDTDLEIDLPIAIQKLPRENNKNYKVKIKTKLKQDMQTRGAGKPPTLMDNTLEVSSCTSFENTKISKLLKTKKDSSLAVKYPSKSELHLIMKNESVDVEQKAIINLPCADEESHTFPSKNMLRSSLRKQQVLNEIGPAQKEIRSLQTPLKNKMPAIKLKRKSYTRGKKSVSGSVNDEIMSSFGNYKDLIIKQSKIHGLGIFTPVPITKNTLIMEYKGEVIGKCMSDKREKFYQRNNIDSIYMFTVLEDMIIDATMTGNKARYINHSCNPNCQSITSMRDMSIQYCSLRNIEPGEELTINYYMPIDESKEVCTCGYENCITKNKT